METIRQAQRIKDQVRLYRDFLDVLTIATQQKLDVLVPDKLPFLEVILEMKANPQAALMLINNQYIRKYSELRMFKGEYGNLSGLMKLQTIKLGSSVRQADVDHDKTICYTSNSIRNKQFEKSGKYLAISILEDSNYVGTKVFMRENMIELISL